MRAGHLSDLPAVIALTASYSGGQSLGFFFVVHVTSCCPYLPNILNSFPENFLVHFHSVHIQTIKGPIETHVKIPQMIVSLNDRFLDFDLWGF